MRRPTRTLLAIVLILSVLAIAATAAAQANSGSTAAAAPGGPGSADAGGSSGSGSGSIGTAPPIRSCGTPQAHGKGPDGTVSITICDDPGPVAPTPTVVTPTPGMADVHPIGFDRATVGADGITVAVDFWAGVAPCSVLDHVDVRSTADAVTITLYEGSDPSAREVACPAIATLDRVLVHLDEPLAGRTILDGVRVLPQG